MSVRMLKSIRHAVSAAPAGATAKAKAPATTCAAALLILTAGSASAALVSAWDLDDASKAGGATAVDSQGANHMTYSASVAQATGHTGVPNTAAAFDGTSNSYAMVSNAIISQLSNSTVEAWFKLDAGATNSYRFIYSEDISGGTVFYLRVNPVSGPTPAQVEFGFRVGGPFGTFQAATNTSVAIQEGQWYYAAGVFSATAGMKAYVFDGVSLTSGSNANTTALTDATNNSSIGRITNPLPQFYFDGAIDNVRVYNTALDLATIVSHLPEPGYGAIAVLVGGGMSMRRRCRKQTTRP